MNPRIDQLAKIIWEYHHMHHPLEKADVILVLGCNDPRVADRAVELYRQCYAPKILFSGGVGKDTPQHYGATEAETFAERAISQGVPREAVLIENRSTNTGENILYSRELLEKMNISVKKVLLVQKPYMERRSFATLSKQWPSVECVVTSPQIPYDDYFTPELPKDDVINIMVGDLQRIREYPKRGFQIEQHIPDEVWNAFNELVELGYSKHLIRD